MLSNLSTSLSRTTVRNALYALGHVEALRDRARFEGAEVPFASMPFAADPFKRAVHELYMREEISLLVTLVDSFATHIGKVPVKWSAQRMHNVISAVTGTCCGGCSQQVRDGVEHLLTSKAYAAVWASVPLESLTPLLSPRSDLGDRTCVDWEMEERIAASAIRGFDWSTSASLNLVHAEGTYHLENRYTTSDPAVLETVGSPSIQNGMHRLNAASQQGATHAVVFVHKRYGAQTPGVALSPEVVSLS